MKRLVHVRLIDGDVYVSDISEHPEITNPAAGQILDHTLDWRVTEKVLTLDLDKIKDAPVYTPEQTGYLVDSYGGLFPKTGDGKCRLSPYLLKLAGIL